MSSILCLNLEQQVLNTELNDKYKTVEDRVAKTTEELADARRKASMLQDEAKALLAQANSKLQLLKGKAVLRRLSCHLKSMKQCHAVKPTMHQQ